MQKIHFFDSFQQKCSVKQKSMPGGLMISMFHQQRQLTDIVVTQMTLRGKMPIKVVDGRYVIRVARNLVVPPNGKVVISPDIKISEGGIIKLCSYLHNAGLRLKSVKKGRMGVSFVIKNETRRLQFLHAGDALCSMQVDVRREMLWKDLNGITTRVVEEDLVM